MDVNMDGIYALRNAIVEQAAKDYLYLKRDINKLESRDKLTRRAKDELIVKKGQLNYLKKWFRSEQFAKFELTNSGEYYIKKLDEMGGRQIHHMRIDEKRGTDGSESIS